jgi:hypothetical protein
MKNLINLSILVALISCSSNKYTTQLKDDQTFLITEISSDKTYALTPENPVEVGGFDDGTGPQNERRYLNALAGPNGESISYVRAGSCCPIKSNKGPFGMAMLDNYVITWEGSNDTLSIFINMYDSGVLKAPVGFTIKN